VNDDAAIFAGADAFCADARSVLEREMNDAALAGRHGVQLKRLPGSENTFSGKARGHAQLLETKGAKTAAIEMDFFMKSRVQPEDAKGQMLKGFQNIAAAGKQNFLVLAIEIGEHFGLAFRRRSGGFEGAHFDPDFELPRANDVVEENAQSCGSGFPVELTLMNKLLRHVNPIARTKIPAASGVLISWHATA
jgi:hypothetical protein